MNARRALDLGLINWVTPDERLEQETERIVHSLIANAPKAVAAGIGRVLAAEYTAVREPVPERLAALLRKLEGQPPADANGDNRPSRDPHSAASNQALTNDV